MGWAAQYDATYASAKLGDVEGDEQAEMESGGCEIGEHLGHVDGSEGSTEEPMSITAITNDPSPGSRRDFLRRAGAGSVLLVTGCSVHKPATRPSATPNDVGQSASSAHAEEGISATEDLMREHGVLDRLLLLYEESRRRLTGQGSFDPSILNRTAGLVRSFIEQYHEKLEETQLFPRFEKARLRDDLVGVLRKQHEAGRRVTDFLIEQTSTASPVHNDALVDAIDSFVRMYRPHAAREDTVLFPALHGLVSPAELHELGEQFEEMEHQRFGKGGFEHVVFQVAELERALGIHDLAQFTP